MNAIERARRIRGQVYPRWLVIGAAIVLEGTVLAVTQYDGAAVVLRD